MKVGEGTLKDRLYINEMTGALARRPVYLWILIISLVYTFFVASFDINLYFYSSTFIISKLQVSQLYIGISVSSFTFGVIIFASVGGLLFNRISIKALVLIALTSATLGTALTGIVSNLPELFVLRFLVGMGTGMLQGTVMGFLGTAYPERRGFLLSLTGTAFSGGLLAGPYLEAFEAPGYLTSFIVASIAGVIAIALVLILMPNVYSGNTKRTAISAGGIFNRNLSLVLAGVFFFGLGFFGFIGYFSHYLVSFLHMSLYISGLTASMLGIGGLFFTLPLGYASDKVGRKNILILMYGLLALTSFLIFGPNITAFALIAVTFVFGAAYNVLIIVVAAGAQDYASSESVGTASGLVFSFYYAGGIIGGTFFGILLSVLPFRETGILAVVTCMLAGLVLTAFIKRTKG